MKSDDFAERTLTHLGFTVEKLPVAKKNGKKMPDFLVRYRASSALVEAKLKGDDPEVASRREDTLAAGEVYASDHVHGRDETLSGIVRTGSRQLKAEVEFESDFKVLFFLMDCINASTVSRQLVDTLYGSTTLIEAGKPPQPKPCYFYRNSDFYRRQEIDAVIVGHIDTLRRTPTLQICLNPYSLRYQALKVSEFLLPFSSAVLDPISEEKAGRAYIPDDDIERKVNDFASKFSLYDPVLHHLANKYKTGPLIRFELNAPEITIRSRNR